MRLNKYLALHTNLSRRAADKEIERGKVTVNGQIASLGTVVSDGDIVTLNGGRVNSETVKQIVAFYKPVGYVCSRNGQGSQTIYDILPEKYHNLNPVGRLDKDSSGILILTNDGELANELTHPRYAKKKIYQVVLDKPLEPLHFQMINDYGVMLYDGPSKLLLSKTDIDSEHYEVTMSEGRNRQIRRTFQALGYEVKILHRTQFGDFALGSLKAGAFEEVPNKDMNRG